jgi:hypothetical protein
MTESAPPLPSGFVHFRDLFRIHMKQILTLDRKPPMHVATLLVLTACETMSTLFERPDDCDVFARDLLADRGVPYHVGKTIFNALRNSLAHSYATGRVVVGRDQIRPTISWKDGGDTHLTLIGVRRQGVHLQGVPFDENEDRHFRLSISVIELWKDLDALFKRLEASLRSDPALAARVEVKATAVLVGDTKKEYPEGVALEAWREYLKTAKWKGPSRKEGT